MKNDIYLTLEKRDLEIREELEFGDDLRHIEAYVETCFDVDRKFGLRTAANDDAWVNLYARYNPFENDLEITYIISTDDSSFERTYQPTETETKMMTMLIEEACVKQMNLNCQDALIRDFMQEAEDTALVCEKVSDNEYQIRNPWGDFVLCREDGTGKLKEHVGHEIEYAKYEAKDGYSFSVECMDCNEVLFAQTDDPYEAVDYEEGVYEYGEYRIIVTPDYKKAIDAGDAPDQVYCMVYAKTDTDCKNNLGEFNMMDGFEYEDATVAAIEEGIKKLMEESMSFYELQRREAEFNRADELLARSVSYIVELTGTDGLRETLIEKLNMTEEEADSMAQEFEVDIEAEQGMTLS